MGKAQAQYKDALTSDSAGGITTPEWLSSTNILQRKGTVEDPSLHLRFYDKVLCFGMPLVCCFLLGVVACHIMHLHTLSVFFNE